MPPPFIAPEPSGSLVEPLDLAPYRSGPLDGLRFTVKDNIDIAGRKTSYGSPAWRDAHPAPLYNALCVDLLLAAGATCVGKAVADEFTYSLDGESHFFGTPRNAKAPERVPGGSSSGSAASVANGLADFSIGTDSGGSIRVPASLCGVWGFRPSLHRISEAGVLPFMPSVSTVGIVADCFDCLAGVARVLLCSLPAPAVPLRRILVVQDALDIADGAVREAAEHQIAAMAERTGLTPQPVSFAEIAGAGLTLADANAKALRNLQTAEFQSTVGNWIEAHTPALGPTFTLAYEAVRRFDRMAALDSLTLCARLRSAINAALLPGTVLCFPTTPTVAPCKGALSTLESVMDFYDRTMAITALSGVAGLPELSAPLMTVDGCPVGLSLAAGHSQDEALLSIAQDMLPPA